MSDSEKNLIQIVRDLKQAEESLQEELATDKLRIGIYEHANDISKNVKELLDCVQEVQDTASDAIIHTMTASDMVADDGSLLGAQVMRCHANKLAYLVGLKINKKK